MDRAKKRKVKNVGREAEKAVLHPSSTTVFPPYGRMHRALYSAIATLPVPTGFAPQHGQDVNVSWQDTFRPILDELANRLWPRWASQAGTGPTWVGRATSTMSELTNADFRLLPGLQPELDQPVVQRATGEAPLATSQPHRSFFLDEDDATLDLPIAAYLANSDLATLGTLATLHGNPPLHAHVVKWMVGHSTAPTLPTKDELQRPRPYQVASLQGRAFNYELARSGVTSSIPSGHCIQGLQGVCMAYLELSRAGVMPTSALARLRQYAVDHGDRRVFAGVHYPSDNLASWCMALALCKPLYGSAADAGRTFLVEAITKHSVVYLRMRDSKDPAYGSGLDWFDSLAAG